MRGVVVALQNMIYSADAHAESDPWALVPRSLYSYVLDPVGPARIKFFLMMLDVMLR